MAALGVGGGGEPQGAFLNLKKCKRKFNIWIATPTLIPNNAALGEKQTVHTDVDNEVFLWHLREQLLEIYRDTACDHLVDPSLPGQLVPAYWLLGPF